MEEKGTSENQQKTNILNEEIREDSMEAERMADAYDIDLNIHKIREGRNIHRGEDELSNDSISDLLIQIDEKQETEDDLDDKIDYAWDDDDADNGLNSVYVAQSSHVNTRTKKKVNIVYSYSLIIIISIMRIIIIIIIIISSSSIIISKISSSTIVYGTPTRINIYI